MLESPEKVPLRSIRNIISEPIKGHEEYHIMVSFYFLINTVFVETIFLQLTFVQSFMRLNARSILAQKNKALVVLTVFITCMLNLCTNTCESARGRCSEDNLKCIVLQKIHAGINNMDCSLLPSFIWEPVSESQL